MTVFGPCAAICCLTVFNIIYLYSLKTAAASLICKSFITINDVIKSINIGIKKHLYRVTKYHDIWKNQHTIVPTVHTNLTVKIFSQVFFQKGAALNGVQRETQVTQEFLLQNK